MSKVKDLTGLQYGKLTVIKRDEDKVLPSGQKKTQWLCQCECGKLTTVNAYKLTSGYTKSCGCLRDVVGDKLRQDLSNRTFGRLTAIKIHKIENHITWWECKCSCGNIVNVPASSLLQGNTKSCGCLSKDTASKIHLKDLIGMKFNMLTVVSRAENHGLKTMWNCKCDCGKECVCYSDVLLNGNQLSCGCSSLSKGETQIENYLKCNNIIFENQKKFDDLLGIGNGNLSYDFYLPQYNLLCEIQGIQHEKPVKYFGGKEKFEYQQEHDRRKREYAKSHGYRLLEIWYYDFDNIEEILNRELEVV